MPEERCDNPIRSAGAKPQRRARWRRRLLIRMTQRRQRPPHPFPRLDERRTMAIEINVGVAIDALVDEVWGYVAQVDRHTDWMADAESIAFLTEQTRGVGTRMSVATAVGPLRTTDIMEFTEWEPPHRMAIRHEGLVTGEGAFTLEPYGEGTWFSWSERIAFPGHLGGNLTGLMAKPILAAVWRRNLARLARSFTGPTPPGTSN